MIVVSLVSIEMKYKLAGRDISRGKSGAFLLRVLPRKLVSIPPSNSYLGWRYHCTLLPESRTYQQTLTSANSRESLRNSPEFREQFFDSFEFF